MPDATHAPARRSRVASAGGHADFPIQSLPSGIFGPRDGRPRAGGAAIGFGQACATALPATPP